MARQRVLEPSCRAEISRKPSVTFRQSKVGMRFFANSNVAQNLNSSAQFARIANFLQTSIKMLGFRHFSDIFYIIFSVNFAKLAQNPSFPRNFTSEQAIFYSLASASKFCADILDRSFFSKFDPENVPFELPVIRASEQNWCYTVLIEYIR